MQIRLYEVQNDSMVWTGISFARKETVETAIRNHSIENPGRIFVVAETNKDTIIHVLMSAVSGQITQIHKN